MYTRRIIFHLDFFFRNYKPDKRVAKRWNKNKQKYKTIIYSSFLDVPQVKTAKKFKISRMRVSQIEHNILRRMIKWYSIKQ